MSPSASLQLAELDKHRYIPFEVADILIVVLTADLDDLAQKFIPGK